MNIIDEVTERFATLETLEGATYLSIGAGLFFGQMFGLIQLATFILIAIGAFKIFVKRDD